MWTLQTQTLDDCLLFVQKWDHQLTEASRFAGSSGRRREFTSFFAKSLYSPVHSQPGGRRQAGSPQPAASAARQELAQNKLRQVSSVTSLDLASFALRPTTESANISTENRGGRLLFQLDSSGFLSITLHISFFCILGWKIAFLQWIRPKF